MSEEAQPLPLGLASAMLHVTNTGDFALGITMLEIIQCLNGHFVAALTFIDRGISQLLPQKSQDFPQHPALPLLARSLCLL